VKLFQFITKKNPFKLAFFSSAIISSTCYAQTQAYTDVTQTWSAAQTFGTSSGANPRVTVNGGMAINANIGWSGSSQGGAGISPFWLQETLTGTSTAAPGSYLWGTQLGLNDQFNTGNSSTMLDVFNIQDSLTTSTPLGSRNVFHPSIFVMTSPADTHTVGTNFPAYVAEFPTGYVKANLGGTGTTYATAAGSVFGVNPNIIVDSGATNLYGAVGEEIDVTAKSGSSLAQKFGLTIIQGTGSVVQGAQDDAALVILNQNGAVGWKAGLSLGTGSAYWPFSSSSSLIYATAGQSGPGNAPAGIGVDLGNVTFSTAAYKSPGITIDPYGRMLTTGSGVSAPSTPTLSSCGSGAIISGSDQAGTVTIGGGAGGTCMVTFAHAWPSTPHCVLTARGTAAPGALAIIGDGTSSITVEATSMPSFSYMCMD
jgi:hypothetical protein